MHAQERRKDPVATTRFRSVSPMFTVSDLDASLTWYRDVLGFYPADEWKNEDGTRVGVLLKAGTVDLMLNQDDFAKGRDREKGVAFRLFCVTAQDVDALAETIKARGGTLDAEPKDQPWGARTFAVSDPDGFKITISSAVDA